MCEELHYRICRHLALVKMFQHCKFKIAEEEAAAGVWIALQSMGAMREARTQLRRLSGLTMLRALASA